MDDALGVAGHGEGHGIRFVIGPEGRRRDHEALVGDRCPRLLELGAVDDNAILTFLDDADEEVRV